MCQHAICLENPISAIHERCNSPPFRQPKDDPTPIHNTDRAKSQPTNGIGYLIGGLRLCRTIAASGQGWRPLKSSVTLSAIVRRSIAYGISLMRCLEL